MKEVFEEYQDLFIDGAINSRLSSIIMDGKGERYTSIKYKNLTPGEFRHAGFDEFELFSYTIEFFNGNGDYTVHHEISNRRNLLTVIAIDEDELSFMASTERIFDRFNVNKRQPIIKDGNTMSQSVVLNRRPMRGYIADLVERFYSSQFEDTILSRVEFREVPVGNKNNLPEEKAEYSTIMNPEILTKRIEQFKELCYKHTKNASGDIKSKNMLVLRPYFIELTREQHRSKKIDMLHNLLENADTGKYGIILIDSYEHYAQKTHELVDRGRIAMVQFTQFGNYHPINDRWELSLGKGKLFYGGTLSHNCIYNLKGIFNLHNGGCTLIPIYDALHYEYHSDYSSREFDDRWKNFIKGIKSKKILRGKA